jgi:hypothetical protein
MMAIKNTWPNLLLVSRVKDDDKIISPTLPFNKSRTRAIHRIGPHNIDALSLIICGMLGD